MNEYRYLKGIAFTLKIKSFEVSAFWSHHGRDGTILSKNEQNKVTAISAFDETGYHRTKGETATRNVLKETLFGGNINYRNNFMKIGGTAYQSQWTAAICPKTSPYNQYDFSGVKNLDLGLDALSFSKAIIFSVRLPAAERRHGNHRGYILFARFPFFFLTYLQELPAQLPEFYEQCVRSEFREFQ